MKNAKLAPPAPKHSSLLIYGLLVGIIFIWGFNWPVSKIGLRFISPYGFSAGRLIVGTLAMFVIVGLAGKLRWPTKRDLPIIVAISTLQVGLFMLCVNVGLNYIDASRSSILVYSTPLWVIPLSVFFFDEKVTGFQWLGFLCGAGGIFILFSPWAIHWHEPHILWGNIVLLLAALSWAVSMLCARHMQWHHSPFELMPWQLLFATIPITLLALVTGSFKGAIWNATLMECTLYAGVLGTSFGYFGAVVVSKELPSSKASIGFLGVPVCGFISSAVFLHESITSTMMLAVFLILLGLIFVALPKQKI